MPVPEVSMSEVSEVLASSEEEVRWVPPLADAPERELVEWANALPMTGGLNIVCRSLSLAEGVFTVPFGPLVANPNGAVHGGIVSAIADQCLGVVSVVNAPRDRLSVTASLHGQFHRPAIPELTIRARLISAGRTLIFVECVVEDARGRRCATFEATMAVGGAERREA
ncbi:PaaI family thioesterase [Sphaerisporangium sp. NPDC051017]|uniref:PaaI family thioesterase n=1 Tax=Sphaerisporangium sp. NPDC051017 TaxID=3154636 RepID=UPI00342C9BC4